MKVFISWSGSLTLSHEVAKILSVWLRKVLPGVEPFFSEDIELSRVSFQSISEQLRQSDFLIACITPENKDAPWIHFEAGAVLMKHLNRGVCPLLVGLRHRDLRGGPLEPFQSCTTTQDSMLRLMRALLKPMDNPGITAGTVERRFKSFWRGFQSKVSAAIRRNATKGESPLRGVWGLADKDTKRIGIFLSSSKVDRTGGYEKTTVSAGQALALTYIHNSLQHAYPTVEITRANLPLSEGHTSVVVREILNSTTIVTLGGPKNNGATRCLAEKWMKPRYWFSKCAKCESTDKECKEYSLKQRNGRSIYIPTVRHGEGLDYGTIIKATLGERKVFIFAGCHSFGTIAAAQAFCEQLPRCEGTRGRASFQVLVRARVSASQVTRAEILPKIQPLRRRS